MLEIENLRTHFTFDDGLVRAVDGVSFEIAAGRTVCVVGESGCGKSITARSILGLIDRPGKIVDGRVWWQPSADGERIDLAKLDPDGEQLRQIRGGEIAMIFQEPMASLSPMYSVGNQLTEAMRVHLPISKAEAWSRGRELLRQVGIPRPDATMEAYPFQLSGGMCQRVMIAIALSCRPQLLIADEPTTALDVTTQARIIDLLRDLQQSYRMSMMFITHDLGVVAEVADDVVVMYLGTVVERGPVDAIFHDPQHPYTRALLKSVPRMGRGKRQRLATIRGQVPHPFAYPSGCPFHPRCDQAVPGLCDSSEPPTVSLGPERITRCVLPELEAGRSARQSELKEA
ncbi:ABC transporter ATP-binding protein [Flindersiella endophytica]